MTSNSHRIRPSQVWLLSLMLLFALTSCTKPPGRHSLGTGPLTAEQEAEAAQLFAQLQGLTASGDFVSAKEVADELLEGFPGSRQEAQALLLGARSAEATRDDATAVGWLRRLVSDHDRSEEATEGWWRLAQLHQERGEWSDEADARVRFYDRSSDTDPRQELTRDRLRDLLEERLEPAELEALAAEHPESIIGSTANWIAARKRYEAGEDPSVVAQQVEQFLRDYPRSRYADRARALLSELSRVHGVAPPAGLNLALSDRIGLLCPLSGEQATLGQAMFDGALLAVEDHNRATGDSLRIVSVDTRSDEVVAVEGARKLIEEDGVVAVVGALWSPSTVAVGVLCQERSVPLVSPVATKETISELGDYVFQTNLTKSVEVRLLARAAAGALRRRRFGVIYPAGEDGRAISELFRYEVERQGGRVVAAESFDRSVTDFGQVIERLRAAAPEAIFVPAGVNELRILAPQLVFHGLPVQLLGLSSWNNTALSRDAGASLDRAIFPSDVAVIPENDRQRFDELWRRRFRGTAPNSFAMKTWFATRQLIEGLFQDGATTRMALRESLAARLEGAGGGAFAGLDRLRMIEDGRIRAFPATAFPWIAAPVPEPDSIDGTEEPVGGDFDR